MRGIHYEDFKHSQVFETLSRAVTESDVISFGRLTEDTSPLQMNEEYAKKTTFEGRIAHGLLTQSIAVGLIFGRLGLFEGTAVAVVGFRDVRFTKPVKIGDAIRARATVIGKRIVSKKDRGLVELKFLVENQDNEVVAEFECLTLVKLRVHE